MKLDLSQLIDSELNMFRLVFYTYQKDYPHMCPYPFFEQIQNHISVEFNKRPAMSTRSMIKGENSRA